MSDRDSEVTSTQPHKVTVTTSDKPSTTPPGIMVDKANVPQVSSSAPVIVAPVVDTATASTVATDNNESESVVSTGPDLIPSNKLINDRLNAAFAVLQESYDTRLVGFGLVAKAQVDIYNALFLYLVNKPYSEFVTFYTNFLDYISSNKNTIYSTTFAFSSFAELGTSDAVRTEYRQLLNIAIDTSVLSTRISNAKSIIWNNIIHMLQPKNGEAIIQRLRQFYKIK